MTIKALLKISLLREKIETAKKRRENTISTGALPNLIQVIKLTRSTSPNTYDIERSYSYLKTICSEHRNRMSHKTLWTLYIVKMLGVLIKIKLKM